jgi:hypothetical protein
MTTIIDSDDLVIPANPVTCGVFLESVLRLL